MRRFRWFSALAGLGVVFAFVATASLASTGALRTHQTRSNTNLTVFTGSASASFADIYVAIEKGFFAKEGLNVKQLLGSLDPSTELENGAAQIAVGTPTTAFIADAAGADIKDIYSPGPNYESFVAGSNVTSPKDLAGKKIGVYSLQDLDVIYTTQMMSQNGIKNGGYTLLAVGPSNNKLAAVKAGSISAAPLYPPTNFQAESDGLHQIFDTSNLKGGALPTLVVVRESWAQKNKPTVVGYLKALNMAHTWLFDPKNKAATIKILEKHTGLPAALAAKSYTLFFSKPGVNYSKAGEWSASAVQTAEPFMVKLKMLTKSVPYASTVDLSYLKAATSGG
jgi:NitT/TauT family transport system substrate-binding protein